MELIKKNSIEFYNRYKTSCMETIVHNCVKDVLERVIESRNIDLDKIDVSKKPGLQTVIDVSRVLDISKKEALNFYSAIVIKRDFKNCSGQEITNWIDYLYKFTNAKLEGRK